MFKVFILLLFIFYNSSGDEEEDIILPLKNEVTDDRLKEIEESNIISTASLLHMMGKKSFDYGFFSYYVARIITLQDKSSIEGKDYNFSYASGGRGFSPLFFNPYNTENLGIETSFFSEVLKNIINFKLSFFADPKIVDYLFLGWYIEGQNKKHQYISNPTCLNNSIPIKLCEIFLQFFKLLKLDEDKDLDDKFKEVLLKTRLELVEFLWDKTQKLIQEELRKIQVGEEVIQNQNQNQNQI